MTRNCIVCGDYIFRHLEGGQQCIIVIQFNSLVGFYVETKSKSVLQLVWLVGYFKRTKPD